MKATREILEFFARVIEKKLGIRYQEENFYQLDMRLSSIVEQTEYETIEALYEKAKIYIPPQLEMMILDLATNNETSFYRDKKVFDKIADIFREQAPHKSILNIWSAASSYGQEPYTLAMIAEEMKTEFPNFRIRITATDISNRVLEAAQNGRYTQLQIQRGLPAPMLLKHFTQGTGEDGLQWEVKDHLKRMVQFKKLNLLEPFAALGMFDLILCRNVLIYQPIENKQTILDRMYERLYPGGLLFLGAAESLIGLNDNFEMIRDSVVTYYKKPDSLQKVG